jgi:hypothetical protein
MKPSFHAIMAGIAVAGAMAPTSHPTPGIDAILWGCAVCNALLAVCSCLVGQPSLTHGKGQAS